MEVFSRERLHQYGAFSFAEACCHSLGDEAATNCQHALSLRVPLCAEHTHCYDAIITIHIIAIMGIQFNRAPPPGPVHAAHVRAICKATVGRTIAFFQNKSFPKL